MGPAGASPRRSSRHRARAGFAALLGLAAVALACSNNFELQSEIRKLRVLAVSAEPAELILQPDAGAYPATTFTALAVEPHGEPVTMEFSLCLVQGALPAADLGCPGDAGIPLPAAGPAMARLDLNDPRYAAIAAQFAAGFAGADGGVDGGAANGGLAAALAAGVPILIGFDASAPGVPDGGTASGDGGVQFLEGFTTVTLRSADAARPINHNPQLDSIRLGGADLAADGSTTIAAGATATLLPIPAAGAKEPTPDGPERLVYSFYSTAGQLSALRGSDTTATGQPGIPSVDYTAPPDAGPVRFWVVVRDGRGGTGWLVRDATVIAP